MAYSVERAEPALVCARHVTMSVPLCRLPAERRDYMQPMQCQHAACDAVCGDAQRASPACGDAEAETKGRLHATGAQRLIAVTHAETTAPARRKV